MNHLFSIPKRFAKNLTTRCFLAVNGGQARAIARLVETMGLTPDAMVFAYMQGMFPLGQADNSIVWQTPSERAVVSSDGIHVSKRLKTYLRRDQFEIKFNQKFDDVVEACANREETWINQPLKDVYHQLHECGIGHSVEAYENQRLVAGGFGLTIGNFFFLESMYTEVNQASKIAFVKLAEKLARDGFAWIDCQYLSEHWKRFGCQPVDRKELVSRMTLGLGSPGKFSKERASRAPATISQS